MLSNNQAPNTKLEQALSLIDKVNAQDPNLEATPDGPQAKELIYGHRMSRTLKSFEPDAEEALQIAVRAQHIKRWQIPRSDYEMNRQGYRTWRMTLAKYHAEETASILTSIDYDPHTIAVVQSLLQKKQLKSDPLAQTLEDVACLVFLEFYLEDFAKKHEREKLLNIIQKTWKKMSQRGHQAALQLPLSSAMNKLVSEALQD